MNTISYRARVYAVSFVLLAGCADASLRASTRHTSDADAVDGPLLDGGQLLDSASTAREAELDAGASADRERQADAMPLAVRRVDLVNAKRWSIAQGGEDPFSDRPNTVDCPRDAYIAELLSDEPAFSVDTGKCHYMTATQTSLVEVPAGVTLQVRVWHFALTAAQPAQQAHVAVRIGDLTVVDERVPIPSAGGLVLGSVRVERAIQAGIPVYFHLHNHGENSWSMVELSAGED